VKDWRWLRTIEHWITTIGDTQTKISLRMARGECLLWPTLTAAKDVIACLCDIET